MKGYSRIKIDMILFFRVFKLFDLLVDQKGFLYLFLQVNSFVYNRLNVNILIYINKY